MEKQDRLITLSLIVFCTFALIVGLSLMAAGVVDTFKSPGRLDMEVQAAAVRLSEREAAKPAIVIGLSVFALGAGVGGGLGLLIAFAGLGRAAALAVMNKAVMIDERRVLVADVADRVKISSPDTKLLEEGE